jgi:flagellar motility protein MotE (MotC chaperone)
MSGTDVAREEAAAAAPPPTKRKSPLLAYLWVWLPFPLMLGGLIFWQIRTGKLEKRPAEAPVEATMFEGAGADMPVLIEALQRERGRLAQEWQDLHSAQKRLLLEQGEIDQRQKQVETLLAKVDDKVKTVSDSQSHQLDQLARVYETMKPDAAAAILGGIDVETATEILQRMKERSAAGILAKVPSDKAAHISERMLQHP